MSHRWSSLVRHGLLGSALLTAASGTARAEQCDNRVDRTLGFVLGVQVSPGLRLVGGVEGRTCVSGGTDAMLRLELGGGSPRLIAGLRTRPLERLYEETDEENLGLEGGVALDLHARFGVHLAATVGTAAYLAVQAHVRPGDQDEQRWSILGGLAPAAAFGGTVVEGRPLVADGHALRPRVLSDLAPVASDELRAARAHFVSSAQLELSSVWTFLRLAAELAAVGAPAELVAAALDAADDEVRHAEMCATLAGGLALDALPASAAHPRFSARSPRALATLVAEAWCEGCLNETAAAEEARLAAAEAVGPARPMLAAIARDEAGHAELSWRVLAWVASVAPVLARATLADMPAYAAAPAESPFDHALARHGVPAPAITAAARAHANATARDRVAAALG